jgi:hypothetical protein
MARWYAKEHIKVDPGLRSVYYLPTNAPEREIRLIEVNDLLVERSDEVLEAIDFGVDTGTGTEHKLFVLDITPRQWTKVQKSRLALPRGWSLNGAKEYARKRA